MHIKIKVENLAYQKQGQCTGEQNNTVREIQNVRQGESIENTKWTVE